MPLKTPTLICYCIGTMKFASRRIISLLLLLVTITGLLVSIGENILCAGEIPGAHENVTTSPTDASDHDCPAAPADSSDDHLCTGDCGCPCQAPLLPAPLLFSYSPSFTSLSSGESISYIPEVYLSLFVPPDVSPV